MGDSRDTKAAVLSALTDFFNISPKSPKDARNHLLETSYVIQSTPDTIEQTTLGELFLSDTKQKGHLAWAIDEPQELFIHEKLAAAWTGWSICADDGTIISHKKGILGLAYTDGRWKISGLASTERSLETPDPDDESTLTQEIMKPINALLDDFSHPDWDVLKQWFLPNAGVTLYRPPAEPAPMTMEQSIVRLQGMIKSGITIQEKLHDIQVRKHGDIALVWAPFVVEINGVPKHDGVNAFTLLRREGRWVFSGCQDYGVALQ
ncbi:hypothetical protein RAB80_007675 [Fusarium oxysporum f. sp. vasinfectum]|uniref:Uncharacterized protein n=1 Tax=Fusarium oxysporum f. sp. vasinfectum 25433 TaxID=1089449 RepID=X0LVC2_FUSOX|nr:hypothetical protein FOTG_04981 [Fusarium oxysporum f. sp. vasinfectum 25433]KAK2675490.1 hypothetical protein RAB80_007675 [Fusarium oxysporum f. sp. vasinfectum]KAK2696621.1 hypothetical protein QWA68_004710 [Fusarium oxysporum]KAK2932156.1 hypothetical protein FoTM2_006613 [Fusarium oxysporum f. sp. vasinfectum]